jgi:hypothetical protein
MNKPHQVINRSPKTTLVNHDMQQYNFLKILHLFYGILNFKFAFKGKKLIMVFEPRPWDDFNLHILILFLILSHVIALI